MPDTTPPQAAAKIVEYFGKLDLDRAQYRDWVGGTVDGGPNGDGTYPLTDFTGLTQMVACPAKSVSMLAAGGGLNLAGFNALPGATQAQVDAAPPVIMGRTADGALRRFTTDMFASRKTADLQPLNDARVDDILSVVRGGVEGRINLGAIATIVNSLTINLSSPPYNVVPDYNELRGAVTVNGSDLLDIPTGQFQAADVGKTLLVSNGLSTGGGPLYTSIAAYISPTRVRMAHFATLSHPNNRIGWGTDNTAGVRLACLHSETPPGADYTFGKTVVVPAGGIMTRAFRPCARTTWFGYGDRQSFFMRLPALPGGTGLDGKGVSYIRNRIVANNTTAADTGRFYKYADDFINFLNVGIHGGRYFHPGGDFVNAFELMSTFGTAPLASVDPFWRVSFLSIWDNAGNGMHTFGRSSSNMGFINILACSGIGWVAESYDDNVNTLVTQGNSQCGLYLGPNGGSNSNFTTIKSSYNGAGVTGNRLGTNVTIDGAGFTLTGFRIQESNNSNILIRGSRNQINGGSIEDTGCIGRHHGNANPPEAISAGILLQNGSLAPGSTTNRLFCYGNKIANVQVGPAVHSQDPEQFASHGLAMLGNAAYGGPKYNEVDFSVGAPFGAIEDNGSVTPWTWQNYGAGSGITGKDGYSSYNENLLRVSGTRVTD